MSSVLTRRDLASAQPADERTGRDLLAEAARKLLRTSARSGLSRSELARESGVSPALVTYYLKDYEAFLSGIATNVADTYAIDMDAILHGASDRDTKLRAIVILFMRMHREDGSLVEPYLGGADSDSRDMGSSRLINAIAGLNTFLGGCGNGDPITRRDTIFARMLLWNACKAAVQLETGREKWVDEMSIEARCVDMILAFFAGRMASNG